MSSISYGRCECCGRKFGFVLESALVDDGGAPPMCGMCKVRGGLCLHNLFERGAGLEPGERLRFHSSRPHDGMQEFADRPEDCPVCQAAREAAAWHRARSAGGAA